MSSHIRAFWLQTFACLLWLTPLGCISVSRTEAKPPPPSEEVRAQLGTILITSPGAAPAVSLPQTQAKGAGTVSGAASGALHGVDFTAEAMSGGSGDFAGFGGLLLLAVAVPTGAIVGGIDANVRGLTAEQLRVANADIAAALRDTDVNAALRQRVHDAGIRNTRRQFVLGGPARSPAMPTTSILEIDARSVGLAGESGVDPHLAAFMSVRVSLIRSADRSVLYQHTWVHRGGSKRFKQWAANSAQPLRDELARARQQLADQIVDELFLASPSRGK